MALQPGMTNSAFVEIANTKVTIVGCGISSEYNCMDLDPYPQSPSLTFQSGSIPETANVVTKAVTVTANGVDIHLSASYDQGVYRWDSVTNGTWVVLGSVAANDWLLTDVYNSTFGDYFWQVSTIGTITYQGNYYKMNDGGVPSTDHRNVLCSTSSTTKSPGIVCRSYNS